MSRRQKVPPITRSISRSVKIGSIRISLGSVCFEDKPLPLRKTISVTLDEINFLISGS